MSIVINNIKVSLDDGIDRLKAISAKKLKIRVESIENFKILRESIDARRGEVKLVYKVSLAVSNELSLMSNIKDKNIALEKDLDHTVNRGSQPLNSRPVVVGSGPAGLFCALRLAEYGYRPLLLERGMDVDSRDLAIKEFWESGKLDPNTNIQFGEGGAGTYSDGKLTTRIKDVRREFVLNTFIGSGAPEEIGYSHKPHIGTDLLKGIVKNIRERITELGGEVSFNSKVTDIVISNDSISSITVNNSESIKTDVLVLAIGHSARDTYEMLVSKSLLMNQKPFAVGVRVEHLQSDIDINQYGKDASHPKLKSAEYKLSHKVSNGRSCYSFCMCPGGTVVNASSEEGHLVVNGMSEYARDGANANSAIVVSVGTEDFGSEDVLAGMYFQREIERKAFELSEGGRKVPVQLLNDFLNSRVSKSLGTITPSCSSGYVFRDLNACLPPFVAQSIKESMGAFGRKISGFDKEDVILTGVETRTSAPIRIARNKDLESENISGIYPCGEGAGYAGGIVSAAVDGAKVAESIISRYSASSII